MQAEHDAILRRWALMSPDGKVNEQGQRLGYLVGCVYEDSKGRFINGDQVFTSYFPIEGIDFVDGAVIQTRNTKYLLQDERKLDAD